ncbi:exodeoxyribonuclease VII large subunit [Planctobacterium marinum]|uniref:exodeoxyribonuclease VII large subunit n=1 Tax=Planctobacterium marinum TaxID=1631968 RepID=UPI001E34204B|nr:exodeoxyribonuclease VII large subunit [Planctobacterium marinum]MCC2606303.1 exodeoxyribonuclease VII large subunit [Planctobacterium marinum]
MQSRSDIFTVSKLNRFAKHILESEIGSIWISAEISNFVAASSGHWYFTLKDARAQVKAAMFKGANRKVRQLPKEGDKVLVRGDISLYEARGDYQLIASHLEPDGQGDLKQQFEQLKTRLADEGLFAQERKRALPPRPQRIGIITSPTGAAIRDIITVFKRRNPGIELTVYPALVQGDGAAVSLRNALKQANAHQYVDALVIGRGGGSMEDLWCFNDEQLARDITQSAIPVVSAVGHEIDFTICDFVADLRAATPSAAAELLSYSNAETQNQLLNIRRQLSAAFVNLLHTKRHALQQRRHELNRLHPESRLREQWQSLDRLQTALQRATEKCMSRHRDKLVALNHRIVKKNPDQHITQLQHSLARDKKHLQSAFQHLLQSKQQQFINQCHLLDTVSPLATLTRGYSITYKDNSIVKSSRQLQKGDNICTKLVDGEVYSQVS